MSLIITREQLDALFFAADAGDMSTVKTTVATIDKANNVTRYSLFVRWQEVTGEPESYVNDRRDYPSFKRNRLNMTRVITREDVLALVAQFASSSTNIQVTPDVSGAIGWTEIDVYSFTA